MFLFTCAYQFNQRDLWFFILKKLKTNHLNKDEIKVNLIILISGFYHLKTALLHKPIHDGLFSNIISKWISPYLKSTVQRIGPLTIKPWSIEETYRFGLIPLLNGMLNHKVNTDEIKPILMQLYNAVSWSNLYFDCQRFMIDEIQNEFETWSKAS